MGFWIGVKRRVRAGVPPGVFLALVAYFCWNATQGEHGLRAYAVRRDQLVQVQAELARVAADRDNWERRVAGLRTQRLDPDTLDERARAMLNVADPADIVVPYGGNKRLF